MKRYISSARKTTSSDLVDALCVVIYSTLDMGDYLEDVVETYAQLGGIELPDDYDADVMLIKVLTELVNQHSEIIPEGIIYNFTEYSDMLLDEIAMSRPSGKQSNLYKSINTIYSQIGKFPGGDSVKRAIEENIFSSPLVEGVAAEIGYAIGQIYWRYIDRPEYGVRTNNAGATGVSNGCRSPKAINGKYKFAFMQDISSYYYDDLMVQNHMPPFTGYMVKFYDDGSDVYADFFNLFVVSSTGGVANWDIGTTVLHTIKINGSDDAAIESAAHEIADWYDDHVDEAIDAALHYAREISDETIH
jgi:hypothetical protein